MIRRCYNRKQASYQFFGARGVRVCSEWLGENGFESFLEHIGDAPSNATTLDRIDPTGNYEPGNVRWTTMREQQRNRTNNRILSVGGRSMCLQAWADELGVCHSAILGRLRRGWSVERALTTPKGGSAHLCPGGLHDLARLPVDGEEREG